MRLSKTASAITLGATLAISSGCSSPNKPEQVRSEIITYINTALKENQIRIPADIRTCDSLIASTNTMAVSCLWDDKGHPMNFSITVETDLVWVLLQWIKVTNGSLDPLSWEMSLVQEEKPTQCRPRNTEIHT